MDLLIWTVGQVLGLVLTGLFVLLVAVLVQAARDFHAAGMARIDNYYAREIRS